MILLKVLEYLAYKVQYAEFNTEDIIDDFSEQIDPYIALELYVSSRVHLCFPRADQDRLTAADFLDT